MFAEENVGELRCENDSLMIYERGRALMRCMRCNPHVNAEGREQEAPGFGRGEYHHCWHTGGTDYSMLVIRSKIIVEILRSYGNVRVVSATRTLSTKKGRHQQYNGTDFPGYFLSLSREFFCW